MLAWFALALALVFGLRWAGYRYGWWERVGAWLALKLDYQETTRDQLAQDLWSQPYTPAPKPDEKRPLWLARLKDKREPRVLSFSHPALRGKWGKR